MLLNTNRYYVWEPLSKDDPSYVSSQEERFRTGADLTACVGQLSAELKRSGPPAPVREIRVVELLDCMKGHGWHLVHQDVFITS